MMSFSLECWKARRTGLVPSFLCAGILAAAVPVLNMSFRSELYLGLPASPIQILMEANWQLMAMLNILAAAAGACMMYHTEYADNAFQRICTLPARESRLFFGKFALMTFLCICLLIIEAAGTAFCTFQWFELSENVKTELVKSFGYAILLMLPAAAMSLWIASACKSVWLSLGISVVCIFTATMLPTHNFALSLFPFALPFQLLTDTGQNTIYHFVIAALSELLLIFLAEIILLKIRRLSE